MGTARGRQQGPVAVGLLLAALGGAPSSRASAWHVHYAQGLDLLQRGDAAQAEAELRQALKRRERSACHARMYGVRFREYVPHYQLALALLRQGRDTEAALELSREMAEGVIGRCTATAALDEDLRARLQALALGPRPAEPGPAGIAWVSPPAVTSESPVLPSPAPARATPPQVAPFPTAPLPRPLVAIRSRVLPLLGLDWSLPGVPAMLLPVPR